MTKAAPVVGQLDLPYPPLQLELTFEPPLPDLGHAGLGRPSTGPIPYRPDDPKLIDQAPYRAFAAKRGPNTA